MSGSPVGMQYRTTSYAANTFDTFYFEKNLQGDIIAVYNASGTKIGSYTYDAWGNCTVSVVSGNTTLENNVVRTYNPFRYRGYYYDTETGLYYLQSRYYNPEWGRFLNADAVYFLGDNESLSGYNLYAYCCNNPTMFVDPTGHSILATLGMLAAGFLVGTIGGAAVDVVLQLITNGGKLDDLDLGSIVNSAIVGGGLGLASTIGAITLGPVLAGGAIVGSEVLHGLCAAATISFGAGAIGYVAENMINNTSWNPPMAYMHGTMVAMEGLHCYVAGGTSGSWGQIGTKGPLVSMEKVLKTFNELMFATPHKIVINMLREKLEEIFKYEFS